MIIRAATERDIGQLLNFWEELMAVGTEADPRFKMAPGGREPMRDFMRTWFDAPPFTPGFIAEVDGEPAGFIRAFAAHKMNVVERAPTARIGDMYVRPEFRRRGIAKALVTRQLEAAREAGFHRAEVGTLTLDRRAVAFWNAMGFGDWMVMLSNDQP